MLTLRRVTEGDIDFLVRVDQSIVRENYGPSEDSSEDRAAVREKMRRYVTDSNRAGWILEEIVTGDPVGMLLGNFLVYSRPTAQWCTDNAVLDLVGSDEALVCEVIQLWVDPDYRRQGWATTLKRELEREAVERGARAVYTHTPSCSRHVVDLNLKLGYLEIRRASHPDHPEVEIVSLVKLLPVAEHATPGL